MGNANSNVTDGIKQQANAKGCKMYELMDLKGSGLLLDLTKQATTTKNYAALDEAIKTKLEPFLYNRGEGKLVHISKIVVMRNKGRPKHRQIFKNEKDYENYKEPDPSECPDLSQYREVCWDLDERGAVGESVLHLCLLNDTAVHAELARRLIRFYPKLIKDVYMSDEYYGENVLHMAIVNEDPAMIKYVLDNGVNVQERCSGAFMSPEDQKLCRYDVLEDEHVRRDLNTNYEGYVYWGEYPASFAACLGQEVTYRLILQKGADPNATDTNGNTALHLLVIHSKLSMFNVAYELGADSGIKNHQNLTPLTLAAKSAKKELFFHIMNIEREIYWQIGSVTCAAYPLNQIDTIDTVTGQIQKESALNLIVFGETTMHLELMEGPVIDLLHAKWNAFIKSRFYRQFIMFAIYFLNSTVAFVIRPIHKSGKLSNSNFTSFLGHHPNTSFLAGGPAMVTMTTPLLLNALNLSLSNNVTWFLGGGGGVGGVGGLNNESGGNFTDIILQDGVSGGGNNSAIVLWTNSTSGGGGNDLDIIDIGHCLGAISTTKAWIQLAAEIWMVLGSIMYLLGAAREWYFLGSSMFFENLSTAPARVLFLISCNFVLVMLVMRLFCLDAFEDIIATLVMLTTAPYFLFFCRGFKTVGPFVVMIYRMITGDLLRFVLIYLVFVMGFSQAFYIIFLSYKKPPGDDHPENPMGTPAESVINMFMMSLSYFDATLQAIEHTDHVITGTLLFVVYMAIVAILLINMLIAMMGNTYTKIAETRNEWQRQWARIVLVVERGVNPKERYLRQGLYSQPMANGRRALVLRLNQSEEEKEEMKELLEVRRLHDKHVNNRLNNFTEKTISITPRCSIPNTLAPPGDFITATNGQKMTMEKF